MRIFAAGIAQETNTFAPWPTGLDDFLCHHEFPDDLRFGDMAQTFVARCREIAKGFGDQFTTGLFAIAQPSGTAVQSAYESMRDEILERLEKDGPFDVVLLFLHGAMVAAEYPDCEGDLIARAREIAGAGCVIGVELDLHCHLTELMRGSADLIILYKEYPHNDIYDRAEELYLLCRRTALREIRPVSTLFDCRMIGFYPTTQEPMAGLLAQLRAAEQRPGVLSVSFGHGFPWGDTPDTGSKMLVVADGDRALAAATARELGRMIYDRRQDLLPDYPTIARALDLAAAAKGRFVMGDTADNAGGGAPSDNPAFLRAMIERRVTKAAVGCFWDPILAQVCANAGLGAHLELRLGGKCGHASGDPLDLAATVRGIRADHVQSGLAGSTVEMGLSIWLESAGIDFVVNSFRTQTFAPDAFTGLGISLDDKHIIVAKSSHHFQAGFRPIADEIIHVATPGALQMDFAAIDYRRRRDLDYFPRVADPLAKAK